MEEENIAQEKLDLSQESNKEVKESSRASEYDDEETKNMIKKICNDNETEERFNTNLQKIRKELGLLALESSSYEPEGDLERIIHMMRWNPGFLFDCDIRQLHEYEAVLCSHALWVKSRENTWNSTYEISDKTLDRAINYACKFSKEKTLKERKSEVINRYEDIQGALKNVELYKFYSDQCYKLHDMFVQMDNSLKKIIETRRIEYERARGIV